jgi:Na+-transporting methylmalonyl-CoA/oxaloacetate decarboxylase gamma subunit
MTGHQILGFITVFLMLLVGLMGVTHRLITRSARKRDQAPPEKADLFRKVHLWSGRLIWVLLVVNTGIGLQLDQAGTALMIGFAVLAVGVILVLAPLYFCVFLVMRKRREAKEEEESSAYQLSQLYVEH